MMEQLLNFFIASTYADTPAALAPPGQPQPSGFFFFIMLAVFVFFFYFAIWRPQNKRAKEQQQLMNSIAKGDEVMSAGGLIGRITKISDQYVSVAVANNVEIVLTKASIVTVLPKGTLKSIE